MEEAQLFWPQVCIVVNDNPEGQLLAGIYDSRLAEFPCRVCWLHLLMHLHIVFCVHLPNIFYVF